MIPGTGHLRKKITSHKGHTRLQEASAFPAKHPVTEPHIYLRYAANTNNAFKGESLLSVHIVDVAFWSYINVHPYITMDRLEYPKLIRQPVSM